jgi:hypothetical protein
LTVRFTGVPPSTGTFQMSHASLSSTDLLSLVQPTALIGGFTLL